MILKNVMIICGDYLEGEYQNKNDVLRFGNAIGKLFANLTSVLEIKLKIDKEKNMSKRIDKIYKGVHILGDIESKNKIEWFKKKWIYEIDSNTNLSELWTSLGVLIDIHQNLRYLVLLMIYLYLNIGIFQNQQDFGMDVNSS